MTQSTADSHSQFHPSQLGPSPSRNRTDKVTLLSSADTPTSIPRFPACTTGRWESSQAVIRYGTVPLVIVGSKTTTSSVKLCAPTSGAHQLVNSTPKSQ